MGNPLPELSSREFERQLLAVAPRPLSGQVVAALETHYRQLLRWNPRLSLIGPGTARDLVERHYGESLAALPLLSSPDRSLLDLGTGAGFPGIPLAIARPEMEVVLAESRQRKWAFLEATLRSVSAIGPLSCRCLNARVESPLPAGWPETIDVVTMRAVRCEPMLLRTIYEHSPGVRFFLWLGESEPDLPTGWKGGRKIELRGARHIREIHPR